MVKETNRGKNKEFLVAGIKNLLKTNYNIIPDLIDIESEVDTSLSFQENWRLIHDKYVNSPFIHNYQADCCDKTMKHDWNYCPYCSSEIQRP